MKMVKSLLLVSAAGLVAVSGAQAADLPVKAKPVEYVKVCSLYGAGFYYIPGTDICLKIGAYFRAEYAFGNMASSLTNLDAVGADGQRTRITGPDYQQRARAFVFLDSRQQTAYGTLRAYMNVGWTSDNPLTGTSAAALYANRAFIQLAGFTWGVATSYYDFFSSPATSYTVPWSSDSGGQINAVGVVAANSIVGLVGPGGTACGAGTFDWQYWSISSRTQWNITKDFYVGLEGFYGHLNTMNKGGAALYTASATGAQPSGVRIFDDQDVFVYRMRVHRDLFRLER